MSQITAASPFHASLTQPACHGLALVIQIQCPQPSSLCARRYDRMKVKEGRAAPQDVTKQCSQCGEAKPGTCFSPNTTSPDGLRSNCKDCQSKYANPVPPC